MPQEVLPPAAESIAALLSSISDDVDQVSERQGNQNVLKATVGTSEEFIDKLSWACSHAMLPNRFWRLFSREGSDEVGPDTRTDDELVQQYHGFLKQYLLSGVERGAFVLEAADFAACASWWPPGSHKPPKDVGKSDEEEQQVKTVGSFFARETDKVRAELIWARYGQDYWHLILIGRDPRKEAVSGAVRAILRPVIKKAAEEEIPIWLVTSSSHARDIYLHYGWQMVKMISFQNIDQWCMILYPPSRA